MIIGGGSAYPRQFDFARMRQIADKVGAYFMVDMAHFAGLVAGGAHPSPVPHAHVVTTTTHKTLRGPRAGMILCQQEFAAGIDRSVFPGQQGGPLMHVIAAKAVAFREALRARVRAPTPRRSSPTPRSSPKSIAARGFRIISGGTDTHLMLDRRLRRRACSAPKPKHALGAAGITVNKNAIPYDTNPPMKPSGIRIGTPALTTRGMKEAEMRTDRRLDRPKPSSTAPTPPRLAKIRAAGPRTRRAVPPLRLSPHVDRLTVSCFTTRCHPSPKAEDLLLTLVIRRALTVSLKGTASAVPSSPRDPPGFSP